MIFDYGLRFPDEFLEERSNCVTSAYLALGNGLLAEHGLKPPRGTVSPAQLQPDESEEVSTALANCPGTLPMIRAVLQVELHPKIGLCVESEMVRSELESEVIRLLDGDTSLVTTDVVAELAASCRSAQIGRLDPPRGGDDRRLTGELLWALAGTPAPTSEFEAMCRDRMMMAELDDRWVERFLDYGDGELTRVSLGQFIRDETTEQEVFDLWILMGNALLACGSNVVYLNDTHHLNLSPDDLRCLSPRYPGSRLLGYVANAPSQAELEDTMRELADRCGAS